MAFRLVLSSVIFAGLAFSQEPAAPQLQQPQTAESSKYVVDVGTRVPLSLINSVSTRNSAPGDRVYLESIFPILVNGKIVIPPGSYVAGTVTEVKKPGRVKGRGELYVRFDSLTLPNGVTRDFRATIGSLDGRASETLDREEGKITGDTDKGGDARVIAESAGAGATVGSIAGAIGGNTGRGLGIGAGAGAAAGLVGVLLGRGPDAALTKGTTVEMVLDRVLSFEESELNFSGAAMPQRSLGAGDGPLPSRNDQRQGNSRWPF